ncbi:MAG: hypothetical protein FJ280_10765 [Planctomycetes bacterium]|nr:hypothetical protein [Planctomycetota bacterium]
MSFRVLVIPEDPTYNGYILQPLVERMLAELGKPNARVVILTNPKLNGYTHAVSAIRGDLIDRYQHFDLWLFLPDGDRAGNLQALESELLERGIRLLCCAAQPEVEAWLLAGHRDELPLPWTQVRRHPRLKEGVFEPFLRQFGDLRSPGAGRERLTCQTLANYRGLLSVCPELADLEDRLRAFLAQGA